VDAERQDEETAERFRTIPAHEKFDVPMKRWRSSPLSRTSSATTCLLWTWLVSRVPRRRIQLSTRA